jgi:hypothetical protein
VLPPPPPHLAVMDAVVLELQALTEIAAEEGGRGEDNTESWL